MAEIGSGKTGIPRPSCGRPLLDRRKPPQEVTTRSPFDELATSKSRCLADDRRSHGSDPRGIRHLGKSLRLASAGSLPASIHGVMQYRPGWSWSSLRPDQPSRGPPHRGRSGTASVGSQPLEPRRKRSGLHSAAYSSATDVVRLPLLGQHIEWLLKVFSQSSQPRF